MPKAIILFEIDKSFGPNILAEYYLKEQDKIPTSTLKEFSDKHAKKNLIDVYIRNNDIRYYSSKINAESLKKDNLFLCFILQEGEDLVSLKSIFQNVEDKIVQNFTTDKKKLTETLKNAINSIFSLIQKLQEPKIIKETINERTKQMLDEGKLKKARELIDLGEEIPEKLAAEVKIAEQLLSEKEYRKARKGFLKAAELATIIQENEIASFLKNKGENVGTFPDLIKKRADISKELGKRASELENNQLYLYNYLIDPIDRLINISNTLEETELNDVLIKLKSNSQRASRLAKELHGLDNKIREFIKKIQDIEF